MEYPEITNNKKIIAFDLDDTLTESKVVVDEEMMNLLSKLLEKKIVAVISGATFHQFEKQLLDSLSGAKSLFNMYVFPTNGASAYNYREGKWHCFGEEHITEKDKERINLALNGALESLGYKPKQQFGPLIEDKGALITFSGLGQEAPLHLKKVWDPKGEYRKKIQGILMKQLPDYEIEVAGTTSINISSKGRSKVYAISKLLKLTDTKPEDILFVGDSVFPGGNDLPVQEMGIDTVKVKNKEGTKELISYILNL
jgi:phosphomannomutase